MGDALQHDTFFHVRVVIGVVVGLTLTRLLLSLARLVQHPGHARFSAIWVGWAVFLLVAVLNLWWFEFGLSVVVWRFEIYAFAVFYAALYFFTCAVLTPDAIEDFARLDAWFDARRVWFYGLLAALLLCDLLDTALKGPAHFADLGPLYPVRQVGLAAAALAAAWARDRRFDAALVVVALASQFALIAGHYDLID
ncbi:hypothetical protein [Amaricoccus sp.]|uniref:hypothetical protein n=1 Tax=Amaricoccus sp. TaxID=1872485 RepID=UPI001B6FD649|nr:hypothetical protein [Amaricoccus sp.]MBP7240889.1 hypothetical protein [Amaricoccus sp.]